MHVRTSPATTSGEVDVYVRRSRQSQNGVTTSRRPVPTLECTSTAFSLDLFVTVSNTQHAKGYKSSNQSPINAAYVPRCGGSVAGASNSASSSSRAAKASAAGPLAPFFFLAFFAGNDGRSSTTGAVSLMSASKASNLASASAAGPFFFLAIMHT